MYSIKEIYYTIQGEGFHSGRPAIFCRFSGCNLWTGREKDRNTAICQFCDTDFWGLDGNNGGRYNSNELVELCSSIWPADNKNPFVVLTGGEPALQIDERLMSSFKKKFEIAIETNGTIKLCRGIDWVCMSPKANTQIVVKSGSEVKFIYPQTGLDPQEFEEFNFDHYYVQPMDGPNIVENTSKCIEFCKSNPNWKLSLQTHKLLGIP